MIIPADIEISKEKKVFVVVGIDEVLNVFMEHCVSELVFWGGGWSVQSYSSNTVAAF